MKATTQRALSLVAAAALVVGGLIIFTTLVIGAYSDVQRLRGELSAKSELYQTQSQQFTQVQNLIAQYQGVTRLQESLTLALPFKEDSADVVNQLNFLAQRNGILINSISLELAPVKKETKTTLVKGFGALRLSLKLNGSYASFKGFIGDLEANIRVMDLADLKITHVGKPNEDFFNYTMTVDAYYQIQ